jgi:hypothetical protein
MGRGAIVATCVLAVLVGPVTAAWGAFPGRNGQLAVGGEIVNPDGTARRPFVPGSGVVWSADGMRVAFNTSAGIAVAGADGDDVRVISADSLDVDPAWSPDGERIAFSRPVLVGEFESPEIFTMRADGSDRRQLTFFDVARGPTERFSPAWSPDGATIVFVEHQFGCLTALAAVRADGSPAPVPFPYDPSIEQVFDPDWSPGSDGLAFVITNACVHQPGSVIIGPSGAGLVGFDPNACGPPSDECPWFENRFPVVSPDGTQVAYWQVPVSLEGSAGARVIAVDGSADRLLAAGTGFLSIDWRPLPAAPPAGVCDRAGARRGGPRSDILAGTPGDDVICGGGGADVLLGRGGHDILVGGRGADVLLGGGGMDRMFGEAGADEQFGGRGDDILVGGPGRDLLRGGAGADSLLSDRDGAADADFCGRGPDLLLADATDARRGCSP